MPSISDYTNLKVFPSLFGRLRQKFLDRHLSVTRRGRFHMNPQVSCEKFSILHGFQIYLEERGATNLNIMNREMYEQLQVTYGTNPTK